MNKKAVILSLRCYCPIVRPIQYRLTYRAYPGRIAVTAEIPAVFYGYKILQYWIEPICLHNNCYVKLLRTKFSSVKK